MPGRLVPEGAELGGPQDVLHGTNPGGTEETQIETHDPHHVALFPWSDTKHVPVTLIIVMTLLAARLALARRPVLLACRTLVVLLGVAGAVDLLLGLRRGGTPAGPALALVLAVALYPAAGRGAVVFRASLAELAEAFSRSARMIRLDVTGGPRRFRLRSGETSATLAVLTWFGGLHPLVFGGSYRSRKTRLFRTVVAKQFGRLIPILLKVRA